MKRRIITDSAASLTMLSGADFAQVPLSIIAGDQIYVDSAELDVHEMMRSLAQHKGRIGTSCPAPADWTAAFGDAGEIFCVSITSRLSGSCNAAQVAAREWMEQHPQCRILVVDSLSAGPEMALLAERLRDLCQQELPFDVIAKEIEAYRDRTQLLFCLQSLHHLSVNGRVSPAIAALIGVLGIRLVGRASRDGELEQQSRARGDRKALAAILESLSNMGYAGGKIIIDHCANPDMAGALEDAVREKWPDAAVRVRETRGLCSYYAEDGGLMIGFEGRDC